MRQHVAGDADAGVAHHDHGRAAFPLGCEPNAAATVGILGGVVEQIGDGLGEPGRICIEVDRLGRHRQREFLTAGVEQWLACFNGGTQHCRQFHALLAQRQLVAGDARDIHEIVDQPSHILQLPIDNLHRRSRIFRTRALELQDVYRIANRGERIPEFVG